jgi:hypothetical protein
LINTGNTGYQPITTSYTTKISIDEDVVRYANEDGTPKANWCVFYTMAVLRPENRTACSIATWYYLNHRSFLHASGCDMDVGVDPADLDKVYTECSVSPGSSVSTNEELASALKDGNGILRLTSNHLDLIYGIEMNFKLPISEMKVLVFDTGNGTGNFYKQRLLGSERKVGCQLVR